MEWEIRPFEGMGPTKFGMTKSDVAAVLGEIQRTRRGLRPNTFSEYRSADAPIIKYIDDQVTEIEAFYGVNNVKIREISFFDQRGISVLRSLERLNNEALISHGIVLFKNIGITTGQLDELVPGEHSVTAFKSGILESKIGQFEKISFLG